MSDKQEATMEAADWKDISSEEERTYEFPEGTVLIKQPVKLNVQASSLGGHAHRVIDASGSAHYIRSGWLAIHWKPKEGSPAVSF